MSSNAKDQIERRQVLANDRSVRSGSTLSDFAEADASIDRGRYSHISKPTVVKSGPDYPSAGGPWSEENLVEPLTDGSDCG